jgi:hypothetical protein
MAESVLAQAPTEETTTPAAAPTTAPPSAPAPSPAKPVSWLESLPPEIKGNKSLSRYSDPAALAKAYVEMEKYQGRSLAIPGPDATPAERAAFDAKVNGWRGVPESADKYTVTMPEGMQADEKGLGEWKGTFHRLGLTQDQVAGLTDAFFGSPTGNPRIAHEQLRTYGETELKREWGGAYSHNLAVAGRAVKAVGGQEVFNLLEATGLNSHPTMVKFWARLGRDYQEDGNIPSASHGGPLGPEDAKRRIAEIRADKAHPYHKGDKDARDEMQALYEVLNGTAL